MEVVIPMPKTGVVIGVSGQIGSAVARRMLSGGWAVRGLHESDAALPTDLAEVDVVVGDRNDDAVLAAVLSGASTASSTRSRSPRRKLTNCCVSLRR
jgi:nucleoside-diphosphate-sugar epimerase